MKKYFTLIYSGYLFLCTLPHIPGTVDYHNEIADNISSSFMQPDECAQNCNECCSPLISCGSCFSFSIPSQNYFHFIFLPGNLFYKGEHTSADQIFSIPVHRPPKSS